MIFFRALMLRSVTITFASAVVSLDLGSHASLHQSPIRIKAVITVLMAPLPQFAV